MIKRILFFSLIMFFVQFSFAQDTAPGEIQPDRPGLGEATSVVPKKYVQIEMGGNFQWDNDGGATTMNLTYNSTFIRIGIFDNVELRLNLGLRQDFVNSSFGNMNTKVGFMPWGLGFKTKLFDQKGVIPRTSFLGCLQIPYPAADFLRTDHIAPYFLIPMEWDLTEKLLMTGNLGVFWNGNDANPNYFASLSYDYVIGKGFGVFIEGFFNLDEDDALFLPMINGGVVWLLKQNIKLDLSAGIGLNKAAPDGFINGGISMRFPN